MHTGPVPTCLIWSKKHSCKWKKKQNETEKKKKVYCVFLFHFVWKCVFFSSPRLFGTALSSPIMVFSFFPFSQPQVVFLTHRDCSSNPSHLLSLRFYFFWFANSPLGFRWNFSTSLSWPTGCMPCRSSTSRKCARSVRRVFVWLSKSCVHEAFSQLSWFLL